MAAAWAVHCDLQRFAPPGQQSMCLLFSQEWLPAITHIPSGLQASSLQSYALIWVGFTVISLFLAWICWYAKGKGKIAVGISALIIAFLFNESFIYGWLCFDLISILELITFLCGLFRLRRSSVKETILMLAIGIVAALLLHQIVPYGF